LGFGIGNAISQIPVRKIGNKKTIFYKNMFMSIILIFILFFTKEVNFSLTYILIAIGIGILGYVPIITFYQSLKIGKVGIVSPIASSSIIFTIFFSVIFFKESLTNIQFFCLFLIILGIIVISINFRDFKKSSLLNMSSGIIFALITAVLWGLVFFLTKIPVLILGPILTAVITEFMIFLSSSINIKLSKENFSIKEKGLIKYLLIIAIFTVAGTLFFNLGINIANVSIVAAIAFSNPLVSTIYGRIVYKEKLTLSQYIGIIFIIMGIIFISLL
ncbi:MAG: EamA family transporter, partial [Candidatus Pacearchaeota archaeon]